MLYGNSGVEPPAGATPTLSEEDIEKLKVRDDKLRAFGLLMPRETLVAEEKALYETHIAMTAQVSRMFEISQRSMLLHAMIKFRLTGGKSPVGKPGFQPFLNENGHPILPTPEAPGPPPNRLP